MVTQDRYGIIPGMGILFERNRKSFKDTRRMKN